LTGFSKADIENLSQIAGSLGCVYESSLTTRTTHLICATTNSTKYARAQRAGIICVTREWLDVSEAEGHPVAEVCPFIVPPLFGCVICPTGISKGERTIVERDCIALGATFSGDLTSSVTHLVAKGSSGSRKYLYAVQRRIAIVTPEWLRRAVQTHSHPDEALFAVGRKTAPPPLEGGIMLPEDASQMSMSSSDPVDPVKEESKPVVKKESKPEDDLPKPLHGCRVAFYGFTTEQRAPLKRLLKELGAEKSVPLDSPDVTHVVVSSNPDIPKVDYEHTPWVKTAAVVEPRWLVACYQIHTRLNETLFRPPRSSHSSAPFMESSSMPSETQQQPSFMEQSAPSSSQRRISPTVEKTMFSGFLFAIIGFDREKTLRYRNQILSHAGLMYDCYEGSRIDVEEEAKVNYLILPHGYPVDDRTKLKYNRFTSAQFASVDWLELCEKTGVVLDLARSPVLTPLKFRPPFDTMLDVVLSFSGFGGQDRLIHTALAHRLGASVTTTFARRANTHLIASCPTGDKFRAACKWGIPVVSINWLRQCAQIGDCAPILQFLLSSPPEGVKSTAMAGTRLPRSKSTTMSGNTAPQYWMSLSGGAAAQSSSAHSSSATMTSSSSSSSSVSSSSVTRKQKHRKSQPVVHDQSVSSASAAEFAPPDTILPSVSGVSSKSAANYLGAMQSQPAVPIHVDEGQDSSSSNDETTTGGNGGENHDDKKPKIVIEEIKPPQKQSQNNSSLQLSKEEIRRKKRSVVKLDVTVCSMDDDDLDDDTLELPAAQMSLFLQPPEPPHQRRGKRCSTGDKIETDDYDSDDSEHDLNQSAKVKRLNRESNPECVVTYEHNRYRDSSKL